MKNIDKESNFLDAKSIPKFEFQLMDDELVNCIKELYSQSKSQEKTINNHKKELEEKLYQHQLVDMLQLIDANLTIPSQLSVLVNTKNNSSQEHRTNNNNNKVSNNNGSNNLIMANTGIIANKLSQIIEIMSIFNNKITQMDKRVTQTEERINLNVKEKVTSVEEQLTQFIKEYRKGFTDVSKKVEEGKTYTETKAKETEMNTLWKINECTKRLEERPTVEMVNYSITEMEQKLIKLFQGNNPTSNLSGMNDTVKIEQDLLKLKKLIDFNTIETQSQVKSLSDKMEHNFMTLKAFAEEKLDLTKKIENQAINLAEHTRKITALEKKLNDTVQKQFDILETINNHNELLNVLNKKVDNITKSDETAKILSQLDPHEICRMSTEIKSLENKMTFTEQRLSSLGTFTESLRSKMEFWNAPNGEKLEKSDDKLNVELITKIIKDEINNSDFRTKMNKHEQQILDLSSLKEGLNDIIKKLNRLNKDNDLNNLKYEIQGVQEYVKKELLILSNRIFTLESTVQNLNDTKRRPLSARTKDDGKMFASLSTKKLIPAGCISCHQNSPMLSEREKEKERRTVFNSKLLYK